MRLKKLTVAILTITMAAGIFTAPSLGLKAQAKSSRNNTPVYIANFVKDIPNVSLHTPGDTVKLYAGLSWESIEADVGVRLNITESAGGAALYTSFQNKANAVGATVLKLMDMDLEAYIQNGGWTRNIPVVTSPVRVSFTLPAGYDLSKDYAVLSMRKDGAVEVLGDLDMEPSTVTVDSSYFDTFALVCGNQGAFNAYRIPDPNALTVFPETIYCTAVFSNVDAEPKSSYIYDLGVIDDETTIRNAVGGSARIIYADGTPGAAAKASLDAAIKDTAAIGSQYLNITLIKGKNTVLTKTNGKLHITMTVPFNAPVYADYAVAVLNEDGTATLMKDMDVDPNAITIVTDRFRAFQIIWGQKGAFDNL